MKNFGATQLLESKPSILHPHEITRNYVEENGIWFFRAQNIRPLKINEANKVFISSEDASRLSKNQLSNGDIVLTRTGANRGDCAYFDSDEETIASSHTFIIRDPKWNHQFLVAFLNSYYGKMQIDKGVYGAAQPEVSPYYLERIWIPTLSSRFQKLVAQYFVDSTTVQETATKSVGLAEKLLLSALGLENWQPPDPLTYTRKASDVWNAERLDSQFFRPDVDALREELSSRFTLVEIGKRVTKGITAQYDDYGTIPIIAISDRVAVFLDLSHSAFHERLLS